MSTKIITGLTKIDNIAGGLDQKEVGLVYAHSGHGKTIALVNFARSALFLKKNVLYVAFENHKRDIIQRISASVKASGKRQLPKECGIKVTNLNYTGTNQVTFDDVKIQIERTKPDIVFIDDFDILLSSRMSENILNISNSTKMCKLFKQLQETAYNFNIPIWVSISVSFSKDIDEKVKIEPKFADLVIGLIQNPNDHKKIKIMFRKRDYEDDTPDIEGYVDYKKSLLLT